jgi:hypothetical protein
MRNVKLERTEIHDFHRNVRPHIDHIDDNVMFLLHAFPFHTVCNLGETLSIRPSTILHHLRNSLDLQPYHFRWVSHELTCHLKEKRVVICRELLELPQMEETFGFARIATGDESWSYLNYSHTHIWSLSDDEPTLCVD